MALTEVDLEKIRHNWQNRNFGFGIWTDPPGQQWENFTHGTDELVTVIEGEVEFEIASVVYHPVIGEELLIPARTLHSVRNIGRQTARWLFGYKKS